MDRAKLVKELEVFAEEIRLETLKEFLTRGFGHVGGAMSVIETLAVLYGHVLEVDPKNPKMRERDYVVMSKGHAGPALYATLALKGYFPLSELDTLNQPGTNLPSHCDRNKTPGIDMTTGSLGQGMSTAIGVALGNRYDKIDNRTYLFIGDGECNEGQIWEGAMFAKHFKMDRFIVFVDVNGQQLDGYTKDVMDMGDIGEKFKAFGFEVQSIDGHCVSEILTALERAREENGLPKAIILNTKKGHGCTIAEGVEANHHMRFKKEDMEAAIEDAKRVYERVLAQ